MSKVTVQTIMNQFNVARDKVKQVKSMQLFIVDSPRYGRILVSYRTIIGIYDFNNCTWYVTKDKFSVTTLKQTSQFINSISNPVVRVEEEEFKKLVK